MRLRQFAWVCAFLTAAPALAACGDEQFSVFLHRFENDLAFQRERVLYPLPAKVGDGRAVEQRRERWTRADLEAREGSLILSNEERRKRDLRQRVVAESADRVTVFHYRPEADSYRILYRFRNLSGCWFLARYENVSL
jgi:hypothetical protein